jgi:hypothetical protein
MDTFSIASLTRSVSMRPFRLRFSIRVSLLEPELRHAMLKERIKGAVGVKGEPRRLRVSWLRIDSVKEDRGARQWQEIG